MKKGYFVTFEGGEGSGKSTQVKILAQNLRSLGLNVVVTREPGGSPLAERLRSLVLDGSLKVHSALTEALLFAAARADHLEQLIRPALERGQIVLCDRFSDSTLVYQGYAGTEDLAKLKTLEKIVIGPTIPDVTILIDLPAEIGLQRIKIRSKDIRFTEPKNENHKVSSKNECAEPDRFESRDLEFHEKLRCGYLKIANQEPSRCVVINGHQDIDKVSAAIWNVLEERIPKINV